MRPDAISGGLLRQFLNEAPGAPGELVGMLTPPDLVGARGAAVFSHDQRYRYALIREWDETRPKLCVIGLNPSTADHAISDPTITRCVKRANSLACGGLVMLNLFAYRATDPTVMKSIADPIGPANDIALTVLSKGQPIVLGAWGNDGIFRNRAAQVTSLLLNAGVTIHALAITKQNQPQHPLYVSYGTAPMIWRRPGVSVEDAAPGPRI
jgi:hypothetical protein